MKKWTTEIQAIDPFDLELKTWMGPIIESPSLEDAERYCQENGLGYCKIIGEFIEEIGWNSALFANKLNTNQN